MEYKEKESAEKAVEESSDQGKAQIMGQKLTINYKISKIKVLEDRDCWFCLDNPNVIPSFITKLTPFYR